MKIFTFLFSFSFFLIACLIGEEPSSIDALKSAPEPDSSPLPDVCFLQFHLAYFYPLGSEFRSFYPGGPIYSLELDCKIIDRSILWNTGHLYLWASGSIFSKQGNTSLNYAAKISAFPLNTGLKWLYTSCNWLQSYLKGGKMQPYLGGGIEFLYLRETTNSPFLTHTVQNWDFGLHWKLGVIVNWGNHFFIDLSGDSFVQCARIYKPSHLSSILTNPTVSYSQFGGAIGAVF
jgi:hypothetical protein